MSPTAASLPERSRQDPGPPRVSHPRNACRLAMCPRCRRYYLPKWTWKHTSARWRKDNWRDGNRHRPFRAVDANKATLALLRHNERVDQQGQRQSKAEGAAAAKGSQAQVDQPSRHSPQTTARLAKAATARGAEAQEPDAATTSFSRIHAAVGQLMPNVTQPRWMVCRQFVTRRLKPGCMREI